MSYRYFCCWWVSSWFSDALRSFRCFYVLRLSIRILSSLPPPLLFPSIYYVPLTVRWSFYLKDWSSWADVSVLFATMLEGFIRYARICIWLDSGLKLFGWSVTKFCILAFLLLRLLVWMCLFIPSGVANLSRKFWFNLLIFLDDLGGVTTSYAWLLLSCDNVSCCLLCEVVLFRTIATNFCSRFDFGLWLIFIICLDALFR